MKETKELNNKRLSIAQGILATLWYLGEGTIKAFFSHPRYAGMYGLKKHSNTYATSLYRLKQKGWVKKSGRNIFTLTPEGKKEALFAYINAESAIYKPEEKQEWDGGWRMIFFDIPEKKRHLRDFLRIVIKAIGFREFQKSIWIYPYEVPSFLKDLLTEERMRHYCRFVITEQMEYDQDLRKMFGLPLFGTKSKKSN